MSTKFFNLLAQGELDVYDRLEVLSTQVQPL